jgi:hypothetical protein
MDVAPRMGSVPNRTNHVVKLRIRPVLFLLDARQGSVALDIVDPFVGVFAMSALVDQFVLPELCTRTVDKSHIFFFHNENLPSNLTVDIGQSRPWGGIL